MAGENNLLNRLAALVAGFDDASWEALASKGLLRRARKDLDGGLEVKVVEETVATLKIEVPPFLVILTASGPAGAKCSCPAPGVCQHILAAGLYLQSHALLPGQPKTAATKESIRNEMLLLTPDRLKAWAGAVDYRNGVALFEKNTLPAVIEYTDTVLIRLMPSGVEVRLIPGGGLDALILPKVHGKRAAVAALLTLRKNLGMEIPAVAAQRSLVEISGSPRTKKEILDSASSVLEDAVEVGLTHVSAVLADRLVTLAVSAQGAHMPRVSLALKSVSDEVKSILRREARADEARLLLLVARVYALMDALREADDGRDFELAGTARGQYVEVPEIELSGVGAYTWQTGSGYAGLTVLFWCSQTSEFLSWSYARPEIQRVDARQRFYSEGPWEGAQSPQQVAASQLKLRSARRTANGRLSSSTKTSALVLSSIVPSTLEFGDRLFASWELLRRYLAGKQPLGLRDPNPLDLIAVLQPCAFGSRSFDSITQNFCWEVYDEVGRSITMTLPFRDWTKESIRILEELSPPQELGWKFVVKLSSNDGELLVEPISILRPENIASPVFQLAFDTLPRQIDSNAAQIKERQIDDETDQSEEVENLESGEAGLPPTIALSGMIGELNKRLEAIAETGSHKGVSAHRDWIAKFHRELHGFGLTALAKALKLLSEQSSSGGDVLKIRYLTHLHSQAIAHLR